MAGLIDIIDAYQNGVNLSRSRAKETAESQEKQSEFQSQHAPYTKGQRDKFGFATGVTPDEEGTEGARARAYFGLDKDPEGATAPQPPRAQPAPPAPVTTPAPEPSLTPSGRPIGATQADLAGGNAPDSFGSPQPPQHPKAGPGKAELGPGDPNPLIRDPKAAIQEADSLVKRPGMPDSPAGPGKINSVKTEDGMKAELGEGTTGVEYDPAKAKFNPKTGRNEIMADRTIQGPAQGMGMDIPVGGNEPAAPPPPPAQAPQPQPAPQKLIPDAYSLKKLVDLNTTMPRSAAGMPVDVNNLPPDVQDQLGVTPEMRAAHIKIPASIVNNLMGGQNKLDVQALKNQATQVDPKYASVLDALQNKEITAGGALAMATRLNNGQPPPPGVMKAMREANAAGNADRSFGLQDKKFQQQITQQQSGTVKSATTTALNSVKGELDGLDASVNVQNLLRQKNTSGLEAKINMMLTRAIVKARVSNLELSNMDGLTGAENKVNQWFQKVQGEGLTNENKALGLFLAQGLEDEYRSAINSRVGWVAKSAARQLQMQGMDENQAHSTISEALDPSKLTDFARNGGGDFFKGNRDVNSGGKPQGAGETRIKTKALDLSTDLGRAQAMGHKNQALRMIQANDKLPDGRDNSTPELKKKHSDEVNKLFEQDMAEGRKKQGI